MLVNDICRALIKKQRTENKKNRSEKHKAQRAETQR
jgi:hypothetical protein